MWTILQYLVLSLLIIGSVHYFYISLKEIFSKDDDEKVPLIIDRKKQEEKREEILKHMREDEKEENELDMYVKNKIKVLNA